MDLIKWSPGRDLWNMHTRLNKFFDEFFTPSEEFIEGMEQSVWSPHVDVYEREGKIVLKAELPGLEKKDIEIEVKDGVLRLKGEKMVAKETKGEKFHRRERIYGKFERAFRLPVEIDAEKIKAEYKDGILTLEVPKPEGQKPKQITVH